MVIYLIKQYGKMLISSPISSGKKKSTEKGLSRNLSQKKALPQWPHSHTFLLALKLKNKFLSVLNIWSG